MVAPKVADYGCRAYRFPCDRNMQFKSLEILGAMDGATILIVEDTTQNPTVLGELLQPLYRVRAARISMVRRVVDDSGRLSIFTDTGWITNGLHNGPLPAKFGAGRSRFRQRMVCWRDPGDPALCDKAARAARRANCLP